MKKGNRYKCTYIDGGGSENHHGDFEVIQEGKVKFKMKRIYTGGFPSWIDDKKEDGFYYISINFDITTKRIKDGQEQYRANKNGIHYGDENEFIVYCNRQGIPFIFKKIQ